MKIVWNILLGIFSVLCIVVLVLQGFGLPSLSRAALLWLRIGAAFFAQWLFSRAFQKNWLRALPAGLTSLVAVWGFFLFLTSPSWRNATFGSFMADYASLAISCAAYWFLRWLLPRLFPRLWRGIKASFKYRKTSKVTKDDMPRFR